MADDTVISAYSDPLTFQAGKPLALLVATECLGRGAISRPLDRCPPSSPDLLASEIGQTFLSTNLTGLLF